MENNLTLIENKVFDEILEKAIMYDITVENMDNHDTITISNIDFNKQLMLRKANFLSKYITIPLDLDETLVDKLENL